MTREGLVSISVLCLMGSVAAKGGVGSGRSSSISKASGAAARVVTELALSSGNRSLSWDREGAADMRDFLDLDESGFRNLAQRPELL